MQLSLPEIAQRLEAFISQEAGSPARVEGLRLLAGGASRAAIALDVTVEAWSRAMSWPAVLRLDLGGKIYETSLDRDEEFRVIAHAGRAGVPVPRVLWTSSDASVLGRPFLILERLEGETIGRRLVQLPELAEARRLLPRQMGQALARIHKVDAADLKFLPRPEVHRGSWRPAATVLERVPLELRRVRGAHPALAAGMRWLKSRAPPCRDLVLVHGDFRLGNMIVGPEGLRAVIDWEFAAIGDRHEDLAWPFVRDWRFGKDELRFAGIADGEGFLAAYEEESGVRVDRLRLKYWEAMGNFRWALGCLTQAHRHLSGEEKSVELASLGRRSAEMELEMLDRIAALAGEWPGGKWS